MTLSGRYGAVLLTGLGELRNGLLVRAADAVVADPADAIATVRNLLAGR